MKSIRSWHFELAFIFLGGLVLLFIAGPLLGLFLKSTRSGIFDAAGDAEVQLSIGRTLLISFTGTLLFALPAIPLSWLLARKSFRGKKLVNGLIDLPIIIPHSAAGIAMLGFISRDSVVGKLAGAIGLNLVGHPAGIAAAMAFVSIPFLVNAARDGFAMVPERYEKAAMSLGANPFRIFFTISIPLAWKNILSGLILMFGRGMSEFGAVIIVAYHPMITPVLIYERFTSYGLKYAQPVSAIFIVVCLLLFVLLRLLTPKKSL
ncbi:MAG: ABC transporter permease [Bacteroidales bacterium]|nr:ABC transporter permease [Bacteroidales bacterium]